MTSSVTWRPQRFAVRWANSEEEVPPWDVWHTGELLDLPKDGPRQEYPDFPPLEDLEVLSVSERARWEEIAQNCGLYGARFRQRGPLRRSVVQENRVGREDVIPHGMPFPRLVRAWPGESRAVRPLADDPGEPVLTTTEWPPDDIQVHVAIARLAKLIPNELAFKAGVIDIVHRYSMLSPEWGDTLLDWQEISLGFHYLRHTYQYLHSEKASDFESPRDLAQTWNDQYRESKIYKRASGVMGRPNLAAALFLSQAAGKAETSAFPLRAIRRALSDNLRERHVSGRFGYASRQVMVGRRVKWSVGAYLRCGVMAWGFHELAEMYAVDPVRQCEVCGSPMEKRRGARTCSDACRQQLARLERRMASEAGVVAV